MKGTIATLAVVLIFSNVDQAKTATVTFGSASVTYYQTFNGNWLPSQMIDGIISANGNGWAIYRNDGQPDHTLSETALLTISTPVPAGAQAWTITIYQSYVGSVGGAHLLGDFSLGYTTDVPPTLTSGFTPFAVTSAKSLNGSTLTSLGNGHLLDNGLLPATDIYTIALTSNSLDPITAILLNVINDSSNGLPTGGPGRFIGNNGGVIGQGNFVISELSADVQVVPIPGALTLFASGLGVIALCVGRRSKKAASRPTVEQRHSST